MAQPGGKRSVDDDMQDLKASVDKYLVGGAELPAEAVTDLTKAIQDLSDHVVNLHHRIENIEDTHDEWTTGGWVPPPGDDRPY